MMIFTFYKNSALATIVSILGCVLIFTGISMTFEGAPQALILCLFGLPFVFWARKISERKEQKKREKALKQMAAATQTR